MKHEGRVPKECVSTRWHKDTEIPSPKNVPVGRAQLRAHRSHLELPQGQFSSCPGRGGDPAAQVGDTGCDSRRRRGGRFQLCTSRREGAVSPGKLLFPERGRVPSAGLRWDGEGLSLPGCDSQVTQELSLLRMAAQPSPAAPAVPGAGTTSPWHRETPPNPLSFPTCHLCLLALDVTAGPAGHLSSLLPILPFLFPFPVALCRFSPSAS